MMRDSMGESGSADDRTAVEVDSLLFGSVVLSYRDDAVTARFEDEPRTTAVITRSGPRTAEKVPIGTRNSSELDAMIDGRRIELYPGKARLLKKSYRVRIEYDDRVLTLAAHTLEDSRLLLGESDKGDNALGVLTREYRGGVDVLWSVPFPAFGKQIHPPAPTRDDALVGIAVAAAFGTGGLSAGTVVMGIVGSVFPS